MRRLQGNPADESGVPSYSTTQRRADVLPQGGSPGPSPAVVPSVSGAPGSKAGTQDKWGKSPHSDTTHRSQGVLPQGSTPGPNACARAFVPNASEALLGEVAERLAHIAASSGDADPNSVPPKRKELDSVDVPAWPTIATWRDWTTQLTRNVNTAANRLDDDAIGWLHAVLKVDTKFDEFYDCRQEFLTLDRKIAKSLSEIIPRHLRDRITNQETVYHTKGQQIKGRQILWMICREFDVNTDLGFTYSIEDLSLMQFPGDEDLQGFLNQWDEILSSIQRERIEPATLAKMFQKKLLSSTVMMTEVARWRRLEAGHPDKSYEWLRKSVETNLRLEKEDWNQDMLQAAHRTGGRIKSGGYPSAPGPAWAGEAEHCEYGPRSGCMTPVHNKPPGDIPCRYLYGFGNCAKGVAGGCKFAHRAPTAYEIVEYGMFKHDPAKANGKGKGSSKRIGMCYLFAENGVCKYGDRCIFSHVAADDPLAPTYGHGNGISTPPPTTEWDEWGDEWNEEWDEEWVEGDPDDEEPWHEAAAWETEWYAEPW
mgnify:FL=1